MVNCLIIQGKNNKIFQVSYDEAQNNVGKGSLNLVP